MEGRQLIVHRRRFLRRVIGHPRQLFSISPTGSSSYGSGPRSGFAAPTGDGQIPGKVSPFLSPRSFPVAEGVSEVRNEFHVSRSRLLYTSTKFLCEPSRSSSAVQIDEDELEEKKPKKHEPSPQECDEAVEVLSSTRAKAQLAKEPTPKKSLAERTRNILVGIGPALKAIASMSRADWAVKIKGWKKAFWDTLQHYWVGTKLLWFDIKISTRLLVKLARGKSLSRRERKQLTRTAADIFRLVPFAVFVIVPFMEFLLPVFLKLFPNMLPSTFQDKMKQQEALKKRLNARMEYAKFLQETVEEMAKEVKMKSHSTEVQRTAEDLAEFLTKVRTGKRVTNEDILAFAKFFNDELTLDNISRSRLVSICKDLGIQSHGTDAHLRYGLRQTLTRIKADDRMIQNEGINSLPEARLRAACRERGILDVTSVEGVKEQLRNWLDLSLNHALPSSLLILSRRDEELIKEEAEGEQEMNVATASEAQRKRRQRKRQLAKEKAKEQQDRLRTKLSAALAVLASASSVSQERAELLRYAKEIGLYVYDSMINESNMEEAKKAYEAERDGTSGAKISEVLINKVDNMLHKLEKEIDAVDAEIGDRWRILDRESALYVRDIALSEMNAARAKESQELAEEKRATKEQQDRLCKLSAALAVLASASSVSKERAELLRLVNIEIGLYNSMANESNMEGAKKAYEAERTKKKEEEDGTSGAKISEVLINKVESMLHKLEKEIDAVDSEIGDRWRILDREAALYIKDTLGSEPAQELINRLAKDSEG